MTIPPTAFAAPAKPNAFKGTASPARHDGHFDAVLNRAAEGGTHADAAAPGYYRAKSPVTANEAAARRAAQLALAPSEHGSAASAKTQPVPVTLKLEKAEPADAGAQSPTSRFTRSGKAQRADDDDHRAVASSWGGPFASGIDLAPIMGAQVPVAGRSATAAEDDPAASVPTRAPATIVSGRPGSSPERATMTARSEQGAASAEARTSNTASAHMPGDSVQADAPDSDPVASGDAVDRPPAAQLAEFGRTLVMRVGLSPTVGQMGLPVRPANTNPRARTPAIDGIAPGQAAAVAFGPNADGTEPLASAPTSDPGTIALDESAQTWVAPLAHELSALLAEGAPRSARLKLHPPALGDIALAVDLRDASVRATLTVATPAAHAVLTAGLSLLADSIATSGLRLDSLQVALGDTGAGAGRHDNDKSPQNGPREPGFAARLGNPTVLDGSSVPSPTPTHQGRVHVYA